MNLPLHQRDKVHTPREEHMIGFHDGRTQVRMRSLGRAPGSDSWIRSCIVGTRTSVHTAHPPCAHSHHKLGKYKKYSNDTLKYQW